MISSASQFSDPARPIGGHPFDLATGQHASQAGLARPASPRLGDHGGPGSRRDLFGDEANVERPHAPVVPIPGYERAGVVGNPRHSTDLFEAVRPSSSRARANPSASSCSESGPCSASHSATPRRPASNRRR